MCTIIVKDYTYIHILMMLTYIVYQNDCIAMSVYIVILTRISCNTFLKRVQRKIHICERGEIIVSGLLQKSHIQPSICPGGVE